ncbi:MAG: thioesterase family protein [Candidatus Deferrimicrobiaceae bacterium]
MEKVATVRVLFADTDAMGIVYYANYLKWFEMGRVEFMRRLGMEYRELTGTGIHLPVTEVSVRYLSPARYDDLLAIHTEIRKCKRASIAFGYRIEREDGVLLAKGETVHAFTDGDGKIVRIPEPFLEKTGIRQPLSSKGGSRGTKPGT